LARFFVAAVAATLLAAPTVHSSPGLAPVYKVDHVVDGDKRNAQRIRLVQIDTRGVLQDRVLRPRASAITQRSCHRAPLSA